MRRRAVLALVSCAALVLAAGASGAGIDGKGVLVCTLGSAAQCDPDAQCMTVTRDDIGMPESFNVDFKGKRLQGSEGKRSSPIGGVEITDTVLIAQGHDNGRGWSMAIDRTTGHMNGTIADVEGAFILTGTCSKAR